MGKFILVFIINFSLILIVFKILSCTDQNNNIENNANLGNENTIIGFWFPCEFASSSGETSDDCMTLDDDGYQFTLDGEIYDLEEATQNSEEQCNGSPCFNFETKSITVNRNLIGTYKYSEDSLFIDLFAISPNYQSLLDIECSETILWDINSEYFRHISYCLPFESSLVKKFDGEVNIN